MNFVTIRYKIGRQILPCLDKLVVLLVENEHGVAHSIQPLTEMSTRSISWS